MRDADAQRERLYGVMAELRSRLGARTLADEGLRRSLPRWGVYFFFEEGETRLNGATPRIVRVGTHAVSRTSKATLGARLSAHRGSMKSGGGNHRGSIFRLHIGTALQRNGLVAPSVESWGQGASAPREVRDRETHVERAVSDHIRRMPFLWVATGPEPEERDVIERGAIALLSRAGRHGDGADPASDEWLGHHADREHVRRSGLWNVNYTTDPCDSAFLDTLARCAERTKID